MSGWISLHRKIQDNWVWEDKPFSKGQAWVDILLSANHSDSKVYFRDAVYEVKRGQKITSELRLAERWGWSRNKVRKFLDDLKKEQMVTLEKDKRKIVITIINYSLYQDNETTKGTIESIKGDTIEGQQKDINNNDNNDNNIYISTKVDICQIDPQEIIDFYNTECKSLPPVKVLTPKRKKTISARIREHGQEAVYEMLKKAGRSCFLAGQNKNGWVATFDWLFKPSNFVKVLEDSYDSKFKTVGNSNDTVVDYYEAAKNSKYGW